MAKRRAIFHLIPEYYSLLLCSKLMGVLITKVSGLTDKIRVYTHCSGNSVKVPGSVTALVINLSHPTSIEIKSVEDTEGRNFLNGIPRGVHCLVGQYCGILRGNIIGDMAFKALPVHKLLPYLVGQIQQLLPLQRRTYKVPKFVSLLKMVFLLVQL